VSTRFIIITPGRSGSTLLQSMIDQHPDATCLGEVLHLDNTTAQQHWKMHAGRKSKRLRESKRFTNIEMAISEIEATYPMSKVCGFKMLYPQMKFDEVRGPIRVIHLTRDPVECAASIHLALATGNWHKTAPGFKSLWVDGSTKSRSISLDPELFRNYLVQWNRADSAVRSIVDADILHLDYSQLTEDFLACSQIVYTWLELDLAFKPEIAVLKSSPPCKDYLDNYKEIRELADGYKKEAPCGTELPNWTKLYR